MSNETTSASTFHANLSADLIASVVVFLVALPLCLGIALASGAPLFSGIVSGIVGGIVVGSLSGSHTSVSGPAAGLTAVVLAEIATLGSFDTFLLALAFAGILQIAMGLVRAGLLSSFVPTSVINGLLAAIGVILILKQIPHVFGHNASPEGEMAFEQPDRENTFTELLAITENLHVGAAAIGLLSLAVLSGWSRSKRLSSSRVPAPLLVVLLGLAFGLVFERLGGVWALEASDLVQVPVMAESDLGQFLRVPDFSAWTQPQVYMSALTIALVASLESLLNLVAVDRLDLEQRKSPPNRELLAQGVGNLVAGLIGGIPVTAVVIRGSVNVHAGARTKRSAIMHGVLLLVSVLALPGVLNRIPLSCLAAILLVTGWRLARPAQFRDMWAAGREQFLPFVITVLAIVFTDLLVGLGIGIVVSLGFIIQRQFNRPFRQINAKHLAGDVLHIELPDQLSFLNQHALEHLLDAVPRGRRVLLDAKHTDYIDPDVLAMLREFRYVRAPARGVELTMVGFAEKYQHSSQIIEVDYSTRELQDAVTPAQVLEILRLGNLRFASGRQINRNYAKQIDALARAQHPLAVVLSCIDSRVPVELILDLGLGDIFSVRVAGNVLSDKVLGSMEFGCALAGARLILVLGHTRCGAVRGAIDRLASDSPRDFAAGCRHLGSILDEIDRVVEAPEIERARALEGDARFEIVDVVARRNVLARVRGIYEVSPVLARLVDERRIAIVGALYNVGTGAMEIMLDEAIGLSREDATQPEPVSLLRSEGPAQQ